MWWPGHNCCDIRERDSGHWPRSCVGPPGTWHRVYFSLTPDTAGAGGWHLRGVITTDYSGSREKHETEKLPELLTLLRAAGAESWELSSPFHSLFCEISSKYRGQSERISKWSIIHCWCGEISSERLYLSDSCHRGWSILTYHRYPRLMMTRAAHPPPPRPRPTQTPGASSWSAGDWWWCSHWSSWCCSVSWSRWVSSTASCITLSTGISHSPSQHPASPPRCLAPEFQVGDENMWRMKTK